MERKRETTQLGGARIKNVIKKINFSFSKREKLLSGNFFSTQFLLNNVFIINSSEDH